MPVELITDGLILKRGHVFIIPQDRDLHVGDGQFHLRRTSKPRGWPDVITIFLRSLAAHWQGQNIPVIVSGLDGDGAAAMREFKEAGGIAIAQRPDTANQPDMPSSAIATGCIDYILGPDDMAQIITALVRRPGTAGHPAGVGTA